MVKSMRMIWQKQAESRGEKKCMQGFGGEIWREKTTWKKQAQTNW
jgi:hypothetical protein